jgi:diguanylate cyclase (GGDEF)-like protein/PAS domain S-box-containing protein
MAVAESTDPIERGDAPDWRDETRLARTLTRVAAVIALVVTCAGPAGFLWLTVRGEQAESAIGARLHAAFITQVIGSRQAGSDWRESISGLIETELTPSRLPEQRRIVDTDGKSVAVSGPAVSPPHLVQRAPLQTFDGAVGEVVVQRSLRPVLWQALLVALASAGIGGAIWVILRVLPLQALTRTLTALRQHEGQARERAEHMLRVVLDHSIEGVVVFNRCGDIVSANAAARRILDRSDDALTHLSVATVITPQAEHDPEDPFPVGQYDTVAHRPDGVVIPVEMTVSQTDVVGGIQRIGIVRDVTERKQHEARLSRLANYDSLTELPNRQLFRDRLQAAMVHARRTGRSFGLMFLDLDRFKIINDSLGHDVGDLLLVAVSKVLAGCVRRVDPQGGPTGVQWEGVYRLGGDEFTVLIQQPHNGEALAGIAQRILQALQRSFVVGGHELYVSASIGITVYRGDATDMDALVKQADMAMYRSKELGRDTFSFYSEELDREAQRRHQIEAQLRHALENQEFRLHYQPKASLTTGQVTGVEALLRWQPSTGELIGPDVFIPILEETGFIVAVGAWVMRESCAQMMRWQQMGLPPINLAVNLSAPQFLQQDLIKQIGDALESSGFDPTRLEIELTESMLITDTESVLRILRELRRMGVRIAIDDFGTGHSSLSYLKRFDLDTLKIDRSFVRDTPGDAEDSAIAVAVISLAHGLGLKVVAEGVENTAQADFLRSQDCDEIQGYLLTRPLEGDDFAAWMAQRLNAAAGETATDTTIAAAPTAEAAPQAADSEPAALADTTLIAG